MSEIASAYVSLIPSLRGQWSRVQALIGREGDAAGRSWARQFSDAAGGGLVSGLARVGAAASRAASLGSVGVAAAGALPSIAAVTASLAPLAGGLSVLPAMAGGGIGALAALKVATSGFADALGSMGDPAKFAEGLKGLSPAAREAAQAIYETRGAWSEMRTVLQDNLFAGLGAQVRQTSGVLQEQVRMGLGPWSVALNKLGRAAIVAVREQAQLGGIAPILSFGAAGASRLSDALVSVVAGMFSLVRGSQQAVAALGMFDATSITDAAARFEAWTQRVSSDGSFARWALGAQTAMSGLMLTLGSLRDIFGAVFGAMAQVGASSGASITALGGALQGLAIAAQQPAFQGALVQFFAGMQSATAALVPVVTSLATVLGPVLGTAMQGLAATIVALAPGIQSLIAGLGPGLSAVVQTLAATLPGLGAALSPIVGLIGQALGQALTSVAPLLGALVLGITRLVVAMAPLVATVLAAATALIGALAPVLTSIATAIIPGLIMAVAGITAAVRGMVSLVTAVIHGDWSAAWAALKVIATGALIALAGLVTGAVDGIYAIIASLGPRISGAMSAMWEGIKALASAALASLVGIVTSRTGEVTSTMAALPGRITGALGDLGGLLLSKGAALIDGLISGIRSRIGDVAGVMGDVAGTIRGFLPGSPVKTGPLRSWNRGGAGRRLAGMLADGLTTSRGLVSSAAARLAGALSAGYGSPDLGQGRTGAAMAARVTDAARVAATPAARVDGSTAMAAQAQAAGLSRADRDLLMALAKRPAVIQVDGRTLATSAADARRRDRRIR